MAWVNGKSGTYNISTNNAPISGYVKWEEKYDVVANKSLVTQTAYLHRTNIYSGETYFYSGTVTRTAFFDSETVGTTVVTDMSIPGNTSSGGGTYVQVYTASKEIAHNADGTKSITLGFSMSNNVSGVAGNSFTVPKTTANVSLTTIPRATKPTLSATTVTMGSTTRITLTPADSSFKHKIRYEFGSLVSQVEGMTSGVDFTSQGTTYHDFTPPTSLGNQIPSANSGTAKLIIYTYRSDGTHVGTETVNITINVPSYTINVISVLAGNGLLDGVYVQGKSTVTVTSSAVASYGASIKSYSVAVDGKTYSGQRITSSALSNGSKTVVVTVTDTRGKTATYTSSAFTVYAYSVPTITEFTLVRQSDGTTVIATVKGSIASVNSKNAKTITVTLNGKTQTITSSSYTINGTTTFTGVSTDNTLTGTARLQDSYTNVTRDYVLPTVAVTMDFHSSGKGVAFGKVAETENLLDVAWEAQFNKAVNIKRPALESLSITRTDSGNGAAIKFSNQNGVLGYAGMSNNANSGLIRWTHDASSSYTVLDTGNTKDYIVEQGTSGVWTYRKWNSGFAECHGYHTVSGLNISTAWGSWYSSTVIALPSFPFTFSGSPDVHVSWESDFSAIIDGVGKRESTKAGQVYLYRPVAQTNVNGRFGIYAYGKWK